MNTLEQYGPPSWLTLLESEKVKIPQGLMTAFVALKKDIREILLGKHEDFETNIEGLLQKTWELRIQAIPVLLKQDFSEALKKAGREFSLIPQRYPTLSKAVRKLEFGLHLMTQFVEGLATKTMDWPISPQQVIQSVPPESLNDLIAQLARNGNPESGKLLHMLQGSLMVEILIFAIDLAADEQLPLDPGICYELEYQAAVAVKEYAAAFGIDKTQMPWYARPKNEMENLLVEGPVVSEADLQYVMEKRAHLNSWK